MRTHQGRYKLTWLEGSQRWRKRYNRKTYYFSGQGGKVQSYSRALKEWEAKQKELDRKETPEDFNRRAWRLVFDQILEKMTAVESGGDSEEGRRDWLYWRDALKKVAGAIERGEPYFHDGEPEEDRTVDRSNVPIVVPDLPAEPPLSPPWARLNALPVDTEGPTSIGGNVQRFLTEKRNQAERGKDRDGITMGRYDKIRICLNEFVSFAGGNTEVVSIDRALLYGYRDFLLKKIDEGRSAEYARNALQIVKQFVRWCWEGDLIELPRILESKDFSISAPEKKIEVFDLDELETLLDASPSAVKLYLLLMLNCGFTQTDIAALRQDEVDWTAGRIKRKRSKTGNHEAVPEVDYKLWPETFKLLKAHRSNDPVLVLVNRTGQPLKTETIKPNGHMTKSDNIRSAFNRVLMKLKEQAKEAKEQGKQPPLVPNKPLKLLRKTASSKLGENPEYARFAQYFLGHSPRTVADKHYVKPSEAQFDKAVEWLGRQLGVINGADEGEDA